MRSNVAMRELIQRYGQSENRDFSLSPKIIELLESPLEEYAGALLLSALRSTVQEPVSRFGDLTGYECAVNHIHLEDFVDFQSSQNRKVLFTMGMNLVHRLKEKLSFLNPRMQFRIILSCNLDDPPGCVVRFHKIRLNENWVNFDDLEGYKTEAILVVDIPGD